MAQETHFSGTTLIAQGFISPVTPCLGASVFILQRYDSRQRAATQTRSSKCSHMRSLAADAGKAGGTRSLPGATPCHRSFPFGEGKGEQHGRSRQEPRGSHPSFPRAPARLLGLAEPRAHRGSRGGGGGAAQAAGLPLLSGGRGAERSPWDGGGGGPAGAACVGRAAQQSPAGESRRHLPGGLPAEAAPVQQPHLAEEDAVDEGHGGKLVQLQLHAELELLLLHHDEGHGPGAFRGSPPRQLRSAPATPLRSAPMPGARAAPRDGAGAAAAPSSAPAGRGAPGQRLHGSRRLPFKPARLRSARCRQRRLGSLASAAGRGSNAGVRFPGEVGPGRGKAVQ